MVTEAITAPIYAVLGDRFGRRPVILILLFLWGIAAIGFGLVQTVLATVVMRGCRE